MSENKEAHKSITRSLPHFRTGLSSSSICKRKCTLCGFQPSRWKNQTNHLQQHVLAKQWSHSRWRTPQLWTFSWNNLWSMLALWAPVGNYVLSQPEGPLPSALPDPQGSSPCSGSAAAVLVSTLSLPHLLLPNFITCRVDGGSWWTDLCPMAWPVLGHTQAWLPSSGEFAGLHSSGPTLSQTRWTTGWITMFSK